MKPSEAPSGFILFSAAFDTDNEDERARYIGEAKAYCKREDLTPDKVKILSGYEGVTVQVR